MLAEVRLICADAIEGMRQLPSESVDCIVTSPPYWGLRDYGTEGQIGLEETPEEYVAKLVAVFREVRRVLKKHGTLWLNLGDAYASPGKGGPWDEGRVQKNTGRALYSTQANRGRYVGLKPKDLVGIPWMVAFALRDDGWWLRSEIIWYKPNCLPESVTDRPTRAHETVFLLAKSQRYFYDADAIREPHTSIAEVPQEKLVGWEYAKRGAGASAKVGAASAYVGGRDRTRTLRQPGGGMVYVGNPLGRNKRSVWIIPSEPFPEAHFATFPQALVEPCILAGTSEYGVCPKCGAPWVRVVERQKPPREVFTSTCKPKEINPVGDHTVGMGQKLQNWYSEHPPKCIGWRPTCSCGIQETVPATVLDPFCGSGTTLLVAQRLGRHSIGIDINPAYIEMARRRTAQAHFALAGGDCVG